MSSTLPLPPEPDPTTQIRDDRGHSTEMISTDAEPVSLATFDRALGSLARLMVRAYQTDVNWEANAPVSPESFDLTVVPGPRPDRGDEAA